MTFTIYAQIKFIRHFYQFNLLFRIWWAIAIVLSISLCTFWVQNIWQTGDPIILRIRKEPKPIYRIPFPAVSICPVTKAAAKKFNYTDVYRALLKFDGDESRTVSPEEYVIHKISIYDYHVPFYLKI